MRLNAPDINLCESFHLLASSGCIEGRFARPELARQQD